MKTLKTGVTMAAVALMAASQGIGSVLVSDTFETDTVNPSVGTAPGTDPANWTAYGEINNANGLEDLSVSGSENGPAYAGANSMSMFDANSVDGRLEAHRYFTPVYNLAIRVAFDLKYSSSGNSGEILQGLPVAVDSNTGGGFWLNSGGGISTWAGELNFVWLNPDQWYRISVYYDAASSAGNNQIFTIIDYVGLTTNTYAMHNIKASSFATGYDHWVFTTGFGGAPNANVFVDNFEVTEVVIPEPNTLLLFGGAIVLIAAHRRRRLERIHA